MEYAKSLRYQKFFSAETIRHEECASLLLHCPCCSEPVFLVVGSSRKEHTRFVGRKEVKVKAASVRPAFHHFSSLKTVESEEKCESYNRQIVSCPKYRQSIEKTGRQQRVENYNKNFLALVGYDDLNAKGIFFKAVKQINSGFPNHLIKKSQSMLSDSIMKMLRDREDTIRNIIIKTARDHLIYVKNEVISKNHHPTIPDNHLEEYQRFCQWAKSVNVEEHLKILVEVLDYLRSQAAYQIREQIFELIFKGSLKDGTVTCDDLENLLAIKNKDRKTLEVLSKAAYRRIIESCIMQIANILALTDWLYDGEMK